MTDSPASPVGLLADPEFVAVASARFAGGFSRAVIIIALALYADLFDATGIVAGLFGTAFALSRLAIVLPVGRLSDLRDTKHYLLLGLAVNGVVFLGFMGVGAVEHVIALRVLQGVGATATIIAGTTVIGEIASDGDRGLWIGTYNQAKALSSLSGDIVGGLLLFRFGFVPTYAVLVTITAIALLAVVACLRDDPGGRAGDDRTGVGTLRALVGGRAVQALMLYRFAFSFGKMAVILFLPIYARTEFGLSALAIGAVLAGGKATKGLAQGRLGDLADRTGRFGGFVLAGTVVYALGTALIPVAPAMSAVAGPFRIAAVGRAVVLPPAFFGLFLAYVVLGVADSFRIPAGVELYIREGESVDAVGGSLSLRSLSWQAGAVVGPLAAGAVLDAASFAAAFGLAAAMVLLAGAIFSGLHPSGR